MTAASQGSPCGGQPGVFPTFFGLEMRLGVAISKVLPEKSAHMRDIRAPSEQVRRISATDSPSTTVPARAEDFSSPSPSSTLTLLCNQG